MPWRGKVMHGVREFACVVDKGIRDLRHRTRGIVVEARSSLKPEAVPDEILAYRVRAKIGRAVSHPGAVEVAANHGRIVLAGPVFEHEIDDLIDAAYSVRGVNAVENRLQPHKIDENVPGLQGRSGRRRPRPIRSSNRLSIDKVIQSAHSFPHVN